ncbi:MAG: LamG domain-containing protein [Bacteroidetes bacterium]|nr:LamG domain-containing protein [Bacteroidota bacterium]
MPKCIYVLLFALTLLPFKGISQSCLVSSYPFNNNTNDLVSSNNGVAYGATPTTDRFGNPNSAYYFDGINDHINFPTDFDFAQRTIMFWFNASNISTTLGCMFEADHNAMSNAQTEIGVRNISGTNKLSICVGASANNWATPSITTNTWYHIAIVRDVSEIRYYLNCQLIATKYDMSNTVSNQSNNTFAALGMVSTNSHFFNGKIDELKIYNCAVSTNVIQEACSVSCSPLAYYNFSNTTNNTISSNFNGTNYGATFVSDINGNPNSALYFDGISNHVDFPTDFDFAQRTIMFWFNASNISTTLGCMFEADHNAMSNAQTEIGVRNISGTNKLSICVGASANNWATPSITTNTWYHIAIVRDVSEIRYYLDCQLIATKFDMSNTVSNQSNNIFAALGMVSTNSHFFNGKIDELKIYNCVLNDTEINAECAQSTGIQTSSFETEKCSEINNQNYLFSSSQSLEAFLEKQNKNSAIKTIHDITGKEIYNFSFENESEIKSQIRKLPNGLFVYTIDCGGSVKKGYFIINYN